MELLTLIIVIVAFLGVFTLEVIAPASKNGCDRRWLVLASSISLFQSFSTVGIGLIFVDLFREVSILEFRDIHFFAQGVLGFVLTSFVAYWWHRAMHKSDFLWRTFHQLHHSPRRIEALTSFYMHPFDGAAATFLNAFCCYFILGLDASGTAVSLICAALYNIFIHADLKTPYWLGYILQRPEMHRVHHKSLHHAQNYGFAVWDLLFGTFSNPKSYVKEVGFDEIREKRVFDMLKTKDVYKTE
ncbi:MULTISPECIES: sterol desaturase family protein [Pseudoalteromonas]|uniref:Sterol desaturase family protein n=1 Tax=Pseudoalteromonas obscura TaxID=3048491 RepID=A0ABT7EFD6_9GAMM|nr:MULTISPECIES: sterol desaturase family protein [Pseudoalteromonas]MBQ4835752.1 sterol desaturase family protein [Pseudoalteromonas luteoviolacea]MDK2593997.1 sterol desaturase family protein [Pseudoalteromonas sp. P94(2023)]